MTAVMRVDGPPNGAPGTDDPRMTRSPKSSPAKLVIVLMGDLSLGTQFGTKSGFEKAFREKGARSFLDGVRSRLDGADLRIANLENVFTDSREFLRGKIYNFKAHAPDYVQVLKENRIDHVNVANNHMADYLQKGFDDTLALLDREGIRYFGTHLDKSPSREIGGVIVDKVAFFEKNGLKIGLTGFLAFDSSFPTVAVIEKNLRLLKQGGADFIIASMHGGGQNTTRVNARQIQIAHQLIDSGADLVYGHHPHILQRVEHYKGKIIYYSLGNFLFLHYRKSKLPETILLQVTVRRGEDGRAVADYENVPVLWMGTEHRNLFRPSVTDLPGRVRRITDILSGKP